MTTIYRVSFCSPGGELDYRLATSPDDAAKAAIELIHEAGALRDGDTINVTEHDWRFTAA